MKIKKYTLILKCQTNGKIISIKGKKFKKNYF